MADYIFIIIGMSAVITLFRNTVNSGVTVLILLFLIVLCILKKGNSFLYLVIGIIFYIYLSFTSYMNNFSGEKSLYAKIDGNSGEVLRIENKYPRKKIYFNNDKNLPFGYYNINYKIEKPEEKNGILNLKGKTLEYEETYLNRIRKYLLDRLESLFEDEYDIYIFSKAAIMGEKGDMERDFTSLFKYTGLAHILVISGMHIGLLITVFIGIFQRAGVGYRGKYILAWIFLSVYCGLVGFSVSVLRSYIMGSIMIFSKIFFEEADTKKSYFISLIITMILLPYSLYDISFQLSYIAVGSILFVNPVVEKFYKMTFKIKNEMADYFIKLALLSLGIQVASAPVFIYNFQVIPVFSFISNIVGIPLGTLSIQAVFLSMLVSFVNLEILNTFAVAITDFIYRAFESYVIFMGKIPLLQLNIKVKVDLVYVISYYILLFIFLYQLSQYNYRKESQKKLKI